MFKNKVRDFGKDKTQYSDEQLKDRVFLIPLESNSPTQIPAKMPQKVIQSSRAYQISTQISNFTVRFVTSYLFERIFFYAFYHDFRAFRFSKCIIFIIFKIKLDKDRS